LYGIVILPHFDFVVNDFANLGKYIYTKFE
jgi:hypothetical protein